MKSTRANKAAAIEVWADEVDEDALVVVDRDALKAIAEYAERRERVDAALTEAVRTARRTGRSWSEIGTMLGVSKQAAQRKYSKVAS
jgi:predicted ATP-dependent protease